MTKKFRYVHQKGDYPKITDGECVWCFAFSIDGQTMCNILNKLSDKIKQLEKENKKLKAQLYCTFDSICAICNNEYLEQKTVLHKNGEYYISKCKKGHTECSKTDVVCCEDFELKDGDV